MLFLDEIIISLKYESDFQIITPDQNQPKPAYSTGIKTENWRLRNQPSTIHNYSKVFVHNNPDAAAQYVITQTERTVNVYPVYNAHPYGRTDDSTYRDILN